MPKLLWGKPSSFWASRYRGASKGIFGFAKIFIKCESNIDLNKIKTVMIACNVHILTYICKCRRCDNNTYIVIAGCCKNRVLSPNTCDNHY